MTATEQDDASSEAGTLKSLDVYILSCVLMIYDASAWGGSNQGAKEAPLSGPDTAEEISALTNDNRPQQLPN